MPGYVLLSPNEGVEPAAAEVAAALDAVGLGRWDGDGLPALAVFHHRGPKGDFFEAGFWAGCGVPVFFVGGGASCVKRKQIVGRLGGWTVVGENGRCTAADLVAAVCRRFTAGRAT
ncbi:MAG TPA: hypothetical protein VD866_24975 [Urbifossiella sp.]|nr:hypothetical protein [Urbifossiella sp.]